MSLTELRQWAADPRNRLNGDKGAEGRLSLQRLCRGDYLTDLNFQRKVDNFFHRHALSGHLFGRPVQNSGFSKRHIALLNWGHDPRKASSPLYRADQDWLDAHPEQRAARRQ